MDNELLQANDWLKNEIKRDQLDTDASKKHYIDEIKSIDKKEIQNKLKTKKQSIFKKLLYILGHGSKK
jgi:hypothetical protein